MADELELDLMMISMRSAGPRSPAACALRTCANLPPMPDTGGWYCMRVDITAQSAKIKVQRCGPGLVGR
uniref:Uncharacterized protein n=1 Tax=Pristionchus pacificus TaxID=54126 RepID=A0A2A6C7U2_PRIPA|eukprot:PDM74229.1 hypothetical protein PRIPAC_41585 [Pristionchus pacificus]